MLYNQYTRRERVKESREMHDQHQQKIEDTETRD